MIVSNWMMYGAYGYSGKLILAELARRELPMPVLAGRDEDKLKPLAEKYNTEFRVFGLDDMKQVRKGIRGKTLVLNVAGPFSRTFRPVVEACLRETCHYLDITGEVAVFERIFECDFRAKTVGITLMPGVGFDVVPTDCVAVSLKQALPEATHLELAFSAQSKISHGTLKTVIETLPQGGLIREKEALQFSQPGELSREIEFEKGKPRFCMAIPWGDVASAFRSTGIPNIVVYTAVPPSSIYATKAINFVRPLLGSKTVQDALGYLVDAFVDGPTETEREAGMSLIWGEARDKSGALWRARAKTSDGYQLTATSAAEAVRRVLAGGIEPGALTPAQAFGPGFLEELNASFKIHCEKVS